jgi:ABC-2 type transport system ATP-binding protein
MQLKGLLFSIFMLSAKHISKSYGERAALADVSLELQAGQFCALLGPNGAGKSTFFQILTGLFRPDAGEVSINGHPMATESTRALAQLGVVFQQPSLDLQLTVRGNLLFHAALHGIARADALRRMESLCAQAGIGAELERRAAQLSGGTRRKVELVRALLHQPQLLLMDEATVGLDPKSRQDLLGAVKQVVAQRGCSVLWATHWVEEVAHADCVLVLHQGRVLAFGSVEDVRQLLGGATLEQGFISATSAQAKSASELAVA